MRLMPNPPSNGGPFILLVDDYRSVLQPLRRILELDGFEVLEAGSAHAAVEHLERSEISVVVCDYSMPVRDGISLLDEVLERWPLTKRLLYSGHFDAELVLEAHGSRHRAVSKTATELLITTIKKLHRAYCAGELGDG